MSSPFFEPPPPPPPPAPQPPPPAWMKPRGVLGAVAPVNFVLARTDEVAVCVWGITAFPNGFDLVVASLLRDPSIDGFRRIDPMRHRFMAFHDGGLADEYLRFGVRCADGSKATNIDRPQVDVDAAGGRILHHRGGGGGGSAYRQNYWCHPLPPPGPIAFVCEWPVFGIPHTEHEIDAAPILEAAEKTKPVWDD